MSIVVDTMPSMTFSKDDWEHVSMPSDQGTHVPAETREIVDYRDEDEKIVADIESARMAPAEEEELEMKCEDVKEESEESEDAMRIAPDEATQNDSQSQEVQEASLPEVPEPAAVPPVIFKKGQHVIYRYANGTEEEMKVIGVHHDDFPNIYYTIQQLKMSPDGEIKEKQTDMTRLRAAPESPESTSTTPATNSPSRSPDVSRSPSPMTHAHKAANQGSKPAFHAYAQPHPEIPSQPKPVPNVHIHTVPKTQHPVPERGHSQQPQQAQNQRKQGKARQQEPEVDPDLIPFSIQVSVSGSRPAIVPGVYPGSTVGDLKHYLAQRIGLPASLLQIIFKGYILNDNNMCMQEVGIQHGSRILVERVQNRRGWF